MRANFVFSEVATGLRRNLTMTVAMIITTAISLGLFGGGLIIANKIGEMKEVYFDKVEISVYLKDDIKKEESAELAARLKASPEVDSVEFLDKKQAYERFKKLFQAQPDFVNSVGPNDLPASYQVRLKDPERYAVISQEFEQSPGVEAVQAQNELLDRLFSLSNGIRNGAIGLALLQAFAALLLISNTIQLAAFNRRTETGIMRLVGASRWYTQLPFLLEAAVAGFIGAMMATGLLMSSKPLFIDRYMKEPIRQGVIPPIDWGDILTVTPIVTAVGVGMASIAAYATLRLYVRL